MHESTDSTLGAENVPSVRKPSPKLLAAGLAGLLGIAAPVACGNEKAPIGDSTGSTGGTAGSEGTAGEAGSSNGDEDAGTDAYNNLVNGDAGDMTMEAFRAICEERGGLLYVNAACAGSAMCKGLSFHDGELYDHSCRGQNSTCAGVGCLFLPEDTGLTGQEIYESGPCADCHADWSATVDFDDPIIDFTKYAVFYNPTERTADEATQRFKDSTDARLESIIGWGTQGFHGDSLPYSNMPSYYQKYSLAEIKRLVAHLRGLCTFTYPYGVFGEEEPDGGYVQSPPDPSCD